MYEAFGFRSAGVRRRYYHDNNEDALIMWRTQGRTRAPRAPRAAGPDPRDRDLVRRHLRGGRRTEGEILTNVISSQARLHARYGGVVPEVASRHHLEWSTPVIGRGARGAGVELATSTVAVTRGPG